MDRHSLYHFDQVKREQLATLLHFKPLFLAGVDEAGRGPLAGPVVAAVVIFSDDIYIDGIHDSKKLNEKKREELFPLIVANALAYGIGTATPKEIDTINILQATFLAMRRAIEAMKHPIHHLLVDGNHKVKGYSDSQEPIIEGDGHSACIAAASILAKVTRDHEMLKLDHKFPEYGFKQHKGYGTKQHIQAIKIHGLSSVHRKSFRPKSLVQLGLFEV